MSFPFVKQLDAMQCGRATISDLLECPLPCILHWNQNHFVVCYGIEEHKHGGYKSPFTTAFLAAKVVSDEPFATRKALLSSVEHGGHKP